MPYNFERLEVWNLALAYTDVTYDIVSQLPGEERYNLASQLRRAATGVALNIAEGSTSQSRKEHSRFLGMAIRSLVETVACQHLIRRRKYSVDDALLERAYGDSEQLFRKLQAFRKSLGQGHRA